MSIVHRQKPRHRRAAADAVLVEAVVGRGRAAAVGAAARRRRAEDRRIAASVHRGRGGGRPRSSVRTARRLADDAGAAPRCVVVVVAVAAVVVVVVVEHVDEAAAAAARRRRTHGVDERLVPARSVHHRDAVSHRDAAVQARSTTGTVRRHSRRVGSKYEQTDKTATPPTGLEALHLRASHAVTNYTRFVVLVGWCSCFTTLRQADKQTHTRSE